MKNPDNNADREKFEKATQQLLNTSVYLKNTHFGKPEATINRPVVDTSYTYCLKVTFNNINEHDNYQKEPAHKTFISEAKELWEKVLIYDSETLY